MRRQKAAEKLSRESSKRRAVHARRFPAPDRPDDAGRRSDDKADTLSKNGPVVATNLDADDDEIEGKFPSAKRRVLSSSD